MGVDSHSPGFLFAQTCPWGDAAWCAGLVGCAVRGAWVASPAAGWGGVGDAGVRMLEQAGNRAGASRSHSGGPGDEQARDGGMCLCVFVVE